MDDIDSLQPLPPRSDEEACRGLPVKLVAIFAHILGIVNREQAEIKIMRGERAVRGEISADEFARLTRESVTCFPHARFCEVAAVWKLG